MSVAQVITSARQRLVWSATAAMLVVGGCTTEPQREPTHSDEPPPGDAFRIPPAHGGTVIVEPGTPFTDGLEILDLVGSATVEVVGVGLLDASTNLTMVGASLSVQTGGTTGFQLLDGYPPDDRGLGHVVPAVGARINSLETVPLLLVGMRVEGSGIARRSGLYVDYLLDGTTYRAEFPAALTVCTRDLSATTSGCE